MLFEELSMPFPLTARVFSQLFYFKQVEEFQALSKEILSLPAKAYFTMIHLDCEELKQGLAKKAKNYAEKLLEKVITSHQQQTLKLVTVAKYFLQKMFPCNYNRQIFCDLPHLKGSAPSLKPSGKLPLKYQRTPMT